MAQILAAIEFIIQMLPLIRKTVNALQAEFPGAGVSKLSALLGILEVAAQAKPELAASYKEVQPVLGSVLTPFVALIKGAPSV
jgi:hypothetical protein